MWQTANLAVPIQTGVSLPTDVKLITMYMLKILSCIGMWRRGLDAVKKRVRCCEEED